MRKLAIASLAGSLVAGALLLIPSSAPATAADTAYQAENATISQGVVESNHAGFTGTGFVNYDNVTGSYVEWTVNVPASGSTTLTFRFANGTTANRPMDIAVDGTVTAAARPFNGTGAWTTWQDAQVTTTLSAGTHTIRATATTVNGGPNVDKLTVSDTPPATQNLAAAPYLYLGWGNPQKPTDVKAATGVKWLTLAFILSDGGCNPAWDGSRGLTGGSDQSAINAFRNAGGDVIPSFGGWSGAKLGEHCSSASALAGAYQKVINAYHLKAIDIDIENTEFHNNTVQQRVIDALKIVKANNPGIKTFITMGTEQNGPDSWGVGLINKGAASGLANDGWVIMPFDFGGGSTNMGTLSIKAAEGLKSRLKSAYGYTDDQAYRHMGISSMNGKTDVAGETVRLQDFQLLLDYANQHHLARFTFWSVNRDRQCSGGGDGDSCSGISQAPYAFTKIIAQYQG